MTKCIPLSTGLSILAASVYIRPAEHYYNSYTKPHNKHIDDYLPSHYFCSSLFLLIPIYIMVVTTFVK